MVFNAISPGCWVQASLILFSFFFPQQEASVVSDATGVAEVDYRTNKQHMLDIGTPNVTGRPSRTIVDSKLLHMQYHTQKLVLPWILVSPVYLLEDAGPLVYKMDVHQLCHGRPYRF